MLEPGTQIGKYRIISKIGAGGMADVYQGEDTVMGRQVALKVLPPEFARDPERIARFEKEVRHLASLDHPGIVTIYDVGRESGCHFYTMVLLPGGDLKQRISRSIPPEEALTILKQTAEALGFAHANHLIHRDIKPENIMFDRQGRPVLTDLGIAKAIGAGTRMTATGMSIGTPHYMSPEQARGQVVDHRSDLYSLGVVFYEMLTGRVPYDAEDSIAIGIKHVTETPPQLPADISIFQPLLDRLLAKNPDDRYHDAGELVQAVAQLRNGKPLPHVAPKTQIMAAATTTGNANPAASGWKWALAGAAAALIIGAGVFHFQGKAVRPIPSGGGAPAPSATAVKPPDPAASVAVPQPSILPKPGTAPEAPAAARVLAGQEPAPNETAAEARRQTGAARDGEAEARRNAEMQARQAEIRRLLSAAESDLAASRLTTPEGSNAAERYRAVLALDATNREAAEGLARVVARYLELSDNALADQNFVKAEAYLARATAVIPDSPGIATARERIAAAREAAEERARIAAEKAEAEKQEAYRGHMASGKSALEQQDQNAAVQNFKAALALAPGDPEASAGLKQAEKIQAQGQTMINSLGMKFVYIAPGTFMMGSPSGEEGREDDEVLHRVTLTKGYWVQNTEVTVGQWRRYARETGYKTEAETDGGAYFWDGKELKKKAGMDWANPGFDQTDRHPVTCVSWNDVQRFVRWMNARDGKMRYRLPTEAEWEYACRAGTTTARFWGDASDRACGYANVADKTHEARYTGNMHACSDGYIETAPVGLFKPNAWGLYDMIGNVWEWCSDWYGDYPSGAVTNPDGPGSGTGRVSRGGSWRNVPRGCRVADRGRSTPGYRSTLLGFRLSGSL